MELKFEIKKKSFDINLGRAILLTGTDLSIYDNNANQIIDKTETICNYFTCGEQINSFKVVYQANGKIYKANASDFGQCAKVVGITLQAGNENEQVLVCSQGKVFLNGWGLNEGIYFLGENGDITQNPTSNICEIGYATDSNTLIFQKGIKIRRM